VPATTGTVDVALPSGGGYSGQLSLTGDAQNIPPGTTLDSTITDQSPTGTPGLSTALHSADNSSSPPAPPVSPLVYFSLTFSQTVALSGAPAFTISLPKNFTVPPNTAFWVAEYDPTWAQYCWQLGFEGPVIANNGQLTFAGSTRPVTFQAGVQYWFMVYATSANGPSPTPAPSPTPTPVPVPSQTPFSVTQSTTLAAATPSASATPVPLAIPTAGGYSGTVQFPVPPAGITAGTTITQTLQDTSPSGPPTLQSALRTAQGARHAEASSDTSIVYLSLTFSTTTSFDPAPSFAIVMPASVPVTAGASYYLALYDPTNPSLGWQLDFEGPAWISGQQLNFASAQQPLTFVANDTYWFGVYARSAGNPTPSPDPSPTAGSTPGAILAVPGSLSFLATGVTQTVTISQDGYAGAFCAVSNNTNVATVSTTCGTTFNVTSVGAGSTTVTVSNSLGQSITVPVGVTTTTIPIN
jgi:hypothetical protein